MKAKKFIGSLAICIVVAGILAAPSRALGQTNRVPEARPAAEASLEGNYNVVSGDLLSITVAGEKELTSEYAVNPDGKINVWLLGEVDAGNRTPARIESELTRLLKADYIINPVVRVIVKKYKKRIVSVIGEVQKPGVVEFDGDHVLLLTEAISNVGGFTKIANRSKIFIFRRGKKIEFDYKEYERNPATYRISPVLEDKDQVDVQQSTF